MFDDLLRDLGKQVKDRQLSWNNATEQWNEATGESVAFSTLRMRYVRLMQGAKPRNKPQFKEFTTRLPDGAIEAQKIVEYNSAISGDQDELLRYLGYDPESWEFVFVTVSTWQQHTREQITKDLYAVKFKVRPLSRDLSPSVAVAEALKVFQDAIKPARLPKPKPKKRDDSLLMEIPPVELHLGKLAWRGDTGEDYDQGIATRIFEEIIERIHEEQAEKKAGRALVVVGSDFFNSDTVDNTTTKGTLQQNDMRYKKMFNVGLRLYRDAFISLMGTFNNVDVILNQGNHDTMSSFYLYVALQQYFAKSPISFSPNCRETQAYRFDKVGLFFNHGDVNLKRLQRSIPAEFYDIWGQVIYRELHVNHLHKEMVVDDEGGMITRRLGSPTGTDAWHYGQRFIGATKKHQVFVWSGQEGLLNCKYIPFSTDYYRN